MRNHIQRKPLVFIFLTTFGVLDILIRSYKLIFYYLLNCTHLLLIKMRNES